MWTGFVFFWFFLSLTLWGIGLHTAMVEFLFFAMGASLTFALSFFIPADNVLYLWLEILFFFVSSGFLFFFFYKRIKKSLSKSVLPSLHESLAKKQGVCQEMISAHHDGSVFCEGSYWRARSSEKIEVGESVEVIKQEGLLLIVKKLK